MALAFISFLGRLLFASVFILSAWQEFKEFGNEGLTTLRSFRPKYDVFTRHVSTYTGFQIPPIEIEVIVVATIGLKAFGGLLFIFGSSLGAFLLLLHQAITIPILCDFYNYDSNKKEFKHLFAKFTQNLALLGALLFFIGMNNPMPRRHFKNKPNACFHVVE